MNDKEFGDILAVGRAAVDQMIACMPEIARLMYAYFCHLVEAGFTEAQALQLTGEYVKTMGDGRE